MGIRPLVSIVSPCYNGADYAGRMLDSILEQTHTNIEMICVNDGSTDQTEAVILAYKDRFSERGMKLHYVRQSNQGQAAALNTGLKYVSGEYLCWIDCDDFLTPDSVEIRLHILEHNQNFGVCTSDLYLINEADGNESKTRNSEIFGHLNFQRSQFYLTIAGMSSIECHGHMLRMSYFDRINPKRDIDCCREGQNYQMLLPMYYHYPRIYVDQPLGYYVIRNNSHYHSSRSHKRELHRQKSLLHMLEKVLSGMGLPAAEVHRLMKISCFSSEIRRLLNNVD